MCDHHILLRIGSKRSSAANERRSGHPWPAFSFQGPPSPRQSLIGGRPTGAQKEGRHQHGAASRYNPCCRATDRRSDTARGRRKRLPSPGLSADACAPFRQRGARQAMPFCSHCTVIGNQNAQPGFA